MLQTTNQIMYIAGPRKGTCMFLHQAFIIFSSGESGRNLKVTVWVPSCFFLETSGRDVWLTKNAVFQHDLPK